MTSEGASTTTFTRDRHVAYWAHSLQRLPQGYDKLDTNRLTLVHFAVHALDLLGVWEDDALQQQLGLNKAAIIEWIYALQVVSSKEDDTTTIAGFQGGTYLGGPFSDAKSPSSCPFWQGHIAMTYTVLCTLTCLGDDTSRVDRAGIVRGLSQLQLDDGSFACTAIGSEHDMRFLYCACSISHMLNDWSGVDVDKAVEYIKSCHSFDGAFALLPGQEGHGGSTFCAVASLVLMKKLDEVLDVQQWRNDLIRWCVSRQVGGMQGRPNKLEDTCYSYWIGGTLRLLGQDSLLDHDALRSFVFKCQFQKGGFSKVIGVFPDMLHAYYSMCYLSLSQPYFDDDDEVGISLKDVNCTLGFCKERAALFEPLFP